jgi:hypothetical protein
MVENKALELALKRANTTLAELSSSYRNEDIIARTQKRISKLIFRITNAVTKYPNLIKDKKSSSYKKYMQLHRRKTKNTALLNYVISLDSIKPVAVESKE